MKTNFLVRSIAASVLLSFMLACSLINAASPQIPTPTVEPTQSGISFSAAPISFVIPEGLATGATTKNVGAVSEQTGAPWDVAPAHLQVTLQGYPTNGSFHDPQIFAYPASEYAAANQSAAESLKRLRAVLAQPTAQYTNDVLPYVPFFNAGQVFAAQEKIIQFNGGSGLRILTQYAQDISPINNGGLFYHFEGLSNDGKFYIVAILPENLPYLPVDNNPASPVPAGGIPFPNNNASGPDFENYFNQITDLINTTQPDQFNPSLNVLDTLIQSISLQ